jgi:CxxC motif-containing protein
MGCAMNVELDGNEVKNVTGNQCKKGIKHARKEVTFPGRVLTTTMKTDIPGIPLVPVRSNEELPKERLLDCMAEINTKIITNGVKLGNPVIKNLLGLGVDIVACRTVPYSFE